VISESGLVNSTKKGNCSTLKTIHPKASSYQYAMTLFTLIGATIFGYMLALTKLPNDLALWITQVGMNRYVLLGGIILVYFDPGM
jgi:TRAP-type C4-dicarboxylate transport system permease large subunit